MNDALDAAFVESHALATVTSWTPSFAVAVDDAIEMKAQKERFFRSVMVENTHYGKIPGVSKPSLWKAGAEMLLANMGLQTECSYEEDPICDITGKDHGGEPYIKYVRRCTVYRQTGTHEHDRVIIARASGSCSSWEEKYRYRKAERHCPKCGEAAIIKGKKEYGGGYVCFEKKGGCKAKFDENDPSIIGQETGKILNPDIADIDNTILKMADKRALIAATVIATGCSDIFTQDIEDMPKQAYRSDKDRSSGTPSIQSLMMKAKEQALCSDGATFCAWAAENVFGCEELAPGVKPTPDQCRAIADALA